ncbi:MAG TPA: amino acid adenylation domain-containing protein, partial [Thermoanaerobaculia bacterium]
SAGRSGGILLREVAELYTALAAGRPSPRPAGSAGNGGSAGLPELPLQLADYALWQRNLEAGPLFARELAYWREQLAGLPPLDLPSDRPRPAVGSGRGGELPVRFAPEVTAAVAGWARERGATPFMALLAGFAALLHRLSGQDDFAVGSAVANRERQETFPLIGCFVNTLTLRPGLAGDPAGDELLARVRRTTLAAYDHQALPFERLVEELAPERDRARGALVQTLLTYENAPPRLDLPDLTFERVALPTGAAKFDLTLVLQPEGDGLAGTLEYSSDLYCRTTAARLLGHYAELLAGLAAEARRPLSLLPLLSAAERHQLLVEGEARPVHGPPATLGERFDAVAARTPRAVAVCHGLDELNYGELHARAERLARRLTALGVGPEHLVAVCMERSLSTVVAPLAVLLAGAAYLPLDPAYPDERLAFVLADARPSAILTHRALLPRLPTDVPAICLDDPEPPAAETPPVLRRALPENLAYVIYTSGSTGRPKGVQVTHANAVRLFAATRERFAFSASDVWTLFHSFAFDFSVWEMWGALLHGGRLVVVPQAIARSPVELHRLLADEGVTVLNQTPSAFRALARLDETEAGPPLAALRLVVFGGEALDPESLRPWLARYGDRRPRLGNMYGITETTVHVTERPLAKADAGGAVSPIGAPLRDLAVHLLDRAGQPVPLGVPGEIHVGGAGLARGYLGRPELTAERFVPDPWSALPGGRLYRSGDLARRLPDGDLAYLGRGDRQVKVRGHRIELGEIEAALAAEPEVAAAVVLAEGGGEDGVRLTAYVVADASDLAALRDRLRRRLPEPMIPAGWVALAALPLTENGKVDRRALAALAPDG